jgi:hypothetical protein
MSVIHGYLLFGLLLVGVPILVHLIMRQKPRLLPFPAFRFLKQKHLINRRKLRLQHWLLLALRMLLIGVIVLGLARPRLAGQLLPRFARAWLGAGTDRPVSAVFVFDTGYHMDYRDQAQSRLDQAKHYALELLRDMAEGSQIAVLDTGDDASEEDWIVSPAQVRARVNGLRPRPVVVPLAVQIDRGRRLLEREAQSEKGPLPLLYVFSDGTRSSWNSQEAHDLRIEDDPTNPLTVTFVYLGVDAPEDVAIDSVRVEPAVVAPGAPVQVSAVVRATGTGFKDRVSCQLDSELAQEPQRKAVPLAAGQSKVVVFNLRAPRRPNTGDAAPFQTWGQVTVRLTTSDNRPFVDALAFNNAGHATFLVRDDKQRQGRKLLTIAADPDAARIWEAAFKARAKYHPADAFEVQTRSLAEAANLTPKDLEGYPVVCLFQAVQVPASLWDTLRTYVSRGGGLIIVPADEELADKKREEFNKAGLERKLLPAELQRLITVDPDRSGILFPDNAFDAPHPLLLPFGEWVRGADPDFARSGNRPRANRYWSVKPVDKEGVILSYADKDKSAALVERPLDAGRVMLFTVVLDSRQIDRDRRWHNYWHNSSFGLLLVNQVASYLAGDINSQELNFLCGQPVVIPLPPGTQLRAAFKLDGLDPDLSDSERNLQAPKDDPSSLLLPLVLAPGNFRLLDRQDQRVAAFSLNVRPEENQLDRVPVEELEAVLGPGTVMKPGPDLRLGDTLQGHKPAPIELLPLLMVLMLLALAFEGVMANRFYRRELPPGPAAPALAGGAP